MDHGPEDERLYTHLLTVLSVSAGMVGVCLTAIGLIGIMRSLNRFETVVDDLLALSGLLFVITSSMSFVGMRTNLRKSWAGFFRWLDAIFFLGLVALVVASAMLTLVVV